MATASKTKPALPADVGQSAAPEPIDWLVLYAEPEPDDRSDALRRLTLTRNRMNELLFPARVDLVIGPVPAVRPPSNGVPLWVANLTPNRPLPGADGIAPIDKGPGFQLWKLGG